MLDIDQLALIAPNLREGAETMARAIETLAANQNAAVWPAALPLVIAALRRRLDGYIADGTLRDEHFDALGVPRESRLAEPPDVKIGGQSRIMVFPPAGGVQ